MGSEQTCVRFPWVALALSFLSSGVGHIYCGRIVKGLFLYAARFLLPLLCIIAAFLQPTTGVLLGLIFLPAAATLIVYLYSAVDAYFIAKRNGSDYQLKEYNRASLYWVLVVMQLAYPVALTWGIREYVYEAYLIPTRSMSPNFLAGDRLLVNKRPLRDGFPNRGDIVVFRAPSAEVGRIWVKRVIGVAGDRIVIRDGEIQVNGKTLQRERVPSESLVAIGGKVKGDVYQEVNGGRRYRVLDAEEVPHHPEADIVVTVPERSLYVMGDNRNRSRDSRHIGAIHAGDVIGYVDYIYGPAESWSRFGVYRDQ